MRATQCNSIHIDRALLARSFQISPVLQKQPHYRLVPFLDGPHQSSASCPAEHIRACILHDGRILLSSNRTPYSSAAFTSAPLSRSSSTIDSCPSSTARIRVVLPLLQNISERADCKRNSVDTNPVKLNPHCSCLTCQQRSRQPRAQEAAALSTRARTSRHP